MTATAEDRVSAEAQGREERCVLSDTRTVEPARVGDEAERELCVERQQGGAAPDGRDDDHPAFLNEEAVSIEGKNRRS